MRVWLGILFFCSSLAQAVSIGACVRWLRGKPAASAVIEPNSSPHVALPAKAGSPSVATAEPAKILSLQQLRALDSAPVVKSYLDYLNNLTYNDKKGQRHANSIVHLDNLAPLVEILKQPIERIEVKTVQAADPFGHPNVYQTTFFHPDGRKSLYLTYKRMSGPYDYMIGAADLRPVSSFFYVSSDAAHGTAWSHMTNGSVTMHSQPTEVSGYDQLLNMTEGAIAQGTIRLVETKTFTTDAPAP